MQRVRMGRVRRLGVGAMLLGLAFAESAGARDTTREKLSPETRRLLEEAEAMPETPSTGPASTEDLAVDDDGTAGGARAKKPIATACHPECRPGYECVDGECVSQCNPPCRGGEVCTAELKCVSGGLTASDVVAEKNVETERIEREERLVGIKYFAGLGLGGGVTLYSPRVGNRIQSPSVEGAFQFGFRGGVFIRQVELSLDVSPGTYLPIVANGESRVSFLALVGYHGHVTDNFYWPLRLGAGLTTYNGDVVFQGRLDVLSLSMKHKHVLTDFTFPSFRYVSDFETFHMWTGLFNVTVSFISE